MESIVDNGKVRKSSLLKWGDEPKVSEGIRVEEIVQPSNSATNSATTDVANGSTGSAGNASVTGVAADVSNGADVADTATTAKTVGTAADAVTGNASVSEERMPINRREGRKPAYSSKEAQELSNKAQKGFNTLAAEEQEAINKEADSSVPGYVPDDDLEGDEPDGADEATGVYKANEADETYGTDESEDEEDYDPFEDYVKPSQEVYDAIKAKEGRGEKLTKDEEIQKFIYENHPGKMPKTPTFKQYKILDMPPAANYTKNYENAYANMLAKMKAYGDDPASKARRAKAARAAKIVAMIGDLLQASINMWGAYKGAQSAKLSSQSKAVRDEELKEEAMAMKRANQYVKELEAARKADKDIASAIDSRALAQWRALNRDRADAARYTYMGKRDRANRAISIFKSKGDKFLSGLRDIATRYGKEALEDIKQRNKLEAQRNASALRKSEDDYRTANKIKVRTTPPAGRASTTTYMTNGSGDGWLGRYNQT